MGTQLILGAAPSSFMHCHQTGSCLSTQTAQERVMRRLCSLVLTEMEPELPRLGLFYLLCYRVPDHPAAGSHRTCLWDMGGSWKEGGKGRFCPGGDADMLCKGLLQHCSWGQDLREHPLLHAYFTPLSSSQDEFCGLKGFVSLLCLDFWGSRNSICRQTCSLDKNCGVFLTADF